MIAGAIGVEAEAIVYLYGACDRDAFHPRIGTPHETQFVDRFSRSEYGIAPSALADFCELTLANEFELACSSAAFWAKHAAGRDSNGRVCLPNVARLYEGTHRAILARQMQSTLRYNCKSARTSHAIQ